MSVRCGMSETEEVVIDTPDGFVSADEVKQVTSTEEEDSHVVRLFGVGGRVIGRYGFGDRGRALAFENYVRAQKRLQPSESS